MRGYQTHEAFWADVSMYFKMIVRAFILGLTIQVMILLIGLYGIQGGLNNLYVVGTQTKMPSTVAIKYYTGFGGVFSGNYIPVEPELQGYAKNNTKLPVDVYRNFVDWLTDNAYKNTQKKMHHWFYLSFLGYIATVLYLVIFISTSKKIEDEKFLRGAKVTPIAVLNKKLAEEAEKNPLSTLKIGDTILPYEMEPKHLLILGTAGSGKSVLLNQLAAQINQRKVQNQTGDRCIFYDLKGEFAAKQYREDLDLIFSPFDARSLGWNIFNELEILPDYDVIAKSLYLSSDPKDEYWYNCAKDVFRTGLVYLKMNNKTRNKDLWEFFSQTLEEIQAAFRTLPLSERGALKHIDKGDSPAAASIVSILQERIQFFRYLVDTDGDFSFRKFIRQSKNNTPQPNLYILNIEQYETIFKPLMTLAIDTMIRETLSLPDDLNRRIFFIIDELGTLYKMNSILKLETVGRSKGACLICANQDLGRIEEQYGKANLKSFFNNFNTNITFRIREPETAEFLSKAIGEQQLVKMMQSRQMSPSEMGDRKSFSEQERTERLIIPTEFQTQEDLEAIINIANFGISHIEVPRIFYKDRYPHFVMREFAPLATTPEPETVVAEEEVNKPVEAEKKADKFDLVSI
ncbi:Hypothetical protein LUCI_3732 [Lucifera butyrica]|uniref:AAA+ ATPase domain-containing protein n=1 Tax=Lucifera butyrica TaxID=1351585 RepID=A0A498RBY9_9FIRM|nr:type IV secretion system DNA-binding domain-containing protein [Lucifera butyrica]VBB08460.1 Hypothetical protein LUCI_3732 [Lucifera butyrica]